MRRIFPLLLLGVLSCSSGKPEDDLDLGPVGDFQLNERGGQTVTVKDLRGKVWIASFIFTRCTGPCPQVTGTMARLQTELKLVDRDDLRLVTFTVDPGHDDPNELRQYAERFKADSQRWLFLTGKQDEIHELILKSFKLAVAENPNKGKTPGDEFDHSTRLVVVDKRGHIRGYCEGLPLSHREEDARAFEASLAKLRKRVDALLKEGGAMIDFPFLNACLNGSAGVLLILGYLAIRARKIALHKACMLAALAVSAVFLSSYLYFHLAIQQGKPTRFSERAPEAPAWMATVYLSILLSHTLLAVIVAPLALVTAYFGLRDHLVKHIRLARWTLPIWIYVSITGVAVYWMLYRLYPAP